MTTSQTLTQLERDEAKLVFERFNTEDVWALGSWLRDQASVRRYPVVIDIRKPGLILFRAAMAGSSPDQQAWVDRKAALVLRMECSSRLFGERLAARNLDPFESGWLNERYTTAGGSVPVRIANVGVVAAVSVAGATSEQDHDLVVEGLLAVLSRPTPPGA